MRQCDASSTAKSPLAGEPRGAARLRNAVQKNRLFIDCEWSTTAIIKICGEFFTPPRSLKHAHLRPVDPDDGQSVEVQQTDPGV
jgi:hypothetical protein